MFVFVIAVVFLCRFASKSQSDWRVDWWDRTRRWALGLVIRVGRFSLVVVAVLQILALDVTAAVVSAGQLHAVFVHAPADASFPATGGLALQGG